MTVVNPKSISGITSITTPSGGDNLLTIHTSDGTERIRVNDNKAMFSVDAKVDANNTRDLGASGAKWKDAYITTLRADVGVVTSFSGDITIDDKIVHSGDTNTSIRFPTTDTVTVETAGSERVRVTSNGYFGVGETPSTKVGVTLAAQVADGTDDGADWGAGGIFQLNASGSAAAGNEILLAGAHSGGLAQVASAIGFGRHNTSDWGTYLSFKTHAADTSNIDSVVERVRINSVGKVGINSTAPDGTLAIEAAVGSAPVLTMRNHPAAGVYSANYGVEYRHAYGSVNHGMLVHTQEAADGRRALDVSDSNGVFATFTNHKVGIGTVTPQAALQVGGGSINSGALHLRRIATYDNNWKFFQSHYDAASYGTLFIQPTLATTPKVEITNAAGVMAARVDTETGAISVKNGGGIYFGAHANTGNMTSELLDDYEEGTWIPSMAFGGGTTGITYSSRSGSYVKIGRLVYLQGQLDLSSKGSATGDATFDSFPFTVGDYVSGTSQEGSGAISWWASVAQDVNNWSFWVSAGSTGGTIYQTTGSGSTSVGTATHGTFNNNSQFRFWVIYHST